MGKKYLFNPIEGTFDIVAGQEENCLLGLSADQGSLIADTVINFVDTVGGAVNNNIIFNNSTHRATLKAGKTYKLLSGLRVWGDDSGDALWFRWYNVTNSSYIGIGGLTAPDSSPSVSGTSPTACAIISPTTDIQVELRYQTGGTSPGVAADTAWATIQKISETFTNVVTVGSIDEKLKRVDNDLFETAQNGIEYYSPTQHGRIYGIVYRKYFDIANANGVGQTIDIPLGVTITQFIGFGGFVEQLGGALLPIPFNWVDYTSDNVGVMILSNKQTLRIVAGTTLDHEGGKCWVDYTK